MVKEPHNLMKFFKYAHLPEVLKQASEPCCNLAELLDDILGDNAEKTVALRKLLECKDAAVRSVIEAGKLTIPVKDDDEKKNQHLVTGD